MADDIANDEYKEYFDRSYEPKVLITSADNPKSVRSTKGLRSGVSTIHFSLSSENDRIHQGVVTHHSQLGAHVASTGSDKEDSETGGGARVHGHGGGQRGQSASQRTAALSSSGRSHRPFQAQQRQDSQRHQGKTSLFSL